MLLKYLPGGLVREKDGQGFLHRDCEGAEQLQNEKDAEQPLNKFARFKENINLWYKEMKDYGLTKEQMEILEPVVKLSYGICESQEG